MTGAFSWQERKPREPSSRRKTLRQVLAIVRLEVRRNLLSRRVLLILLLASSPVALLLLRAFSHIPPRVFNDLPRANVSYAVVFRTFFLRFALFFGCVGVFMNLFRGEVLEKTLHYYFLVPVSRPLVLIGKYLAGVGVTFLLFGASTLLSYLLLYLPARDDLARDYLLAGPGSAHLLSYLGVTLLGAVGYGAVFLLMGLYFRNPMIPAAVVLGWESINFLLPPFLKKVSVIHYLESLCPVSIPPRTITILADPSSPAVAIPGILGLTLLLLALAARRIRRAEVCYSTQD